MAPGSRARGFGSGRPDDRRSAEGVAKTFGIQVYSLINIDVTKWFWRRFHRPAPFLGIIGSNVCATRSFLSHFRAGNGGVPVGNRILFRQDSTSRDARLNHGFVSFAFRVRRLAAFPVL